MVLGIKERLLMEYLKDMVVKSTKMEILMKEYLRMEQKKVQAFINFSKNQLMKESLKKDA